MLWFQQHWLHVTLLLGYLSVLAWHAWEGKRHTRSLSDYLIAGRSLGGLVVALSFYATFMSTNTFVGQAGKSWDVGLIWYINGFVLAGLCLVSWMFVAGPFVEQTRRLGSLTVADYLGFRYGSLALRRLAAVVIFVGSIIYLLAVYKGSALALEQFLGVSYSTAAILVFFVVTAYTLAGGFRSVALTDAMQGTLMVFGAVAILVAVVMRGGGLSALLEGVRRADPQMLSWQSKIPFSTMLGLAIAGGLKFLVEPRQLSRFYGLRDQASLRLARVVSPLLIAVTYFCLLPIGAFAHALAPAGAIQHSDQIVPYLLGTAELFGPLLSSCFLLVLVSAAMSSLDSVLLVAASSMDHDLFAPEGTDASAISRTRIWVVVISLVSMALSLNPVGGIVEITSLSGSLYGACFLPALVVGLYWKGATAAGALASMICGAVTVIGWFVARKSLDWVSLHEVYVGVTVGLVTFVGVSLVTAAPATVEAATEPE